MYLSILATLIVLFCCFGNCQNDDDDNGGFYSNKEIDLDPSRHEADFFKFVTVRMTLYWHEGSEPISQQRPDIDAPKWDITTYNKSAVSPGYWFVAPYGAVDQVRNNHAYVAPHIYDSDGELVWSGAKMFKRFNTFTFKVSEVRGKPMLSLLFFAKREGHLIDQSYKLRSVVPIGGDGFAANMHEFQIVDGGTRAVYFTKRSTKSRENAEWVGYEDGQCKLAFQRIEERDIKTGEITFEWSAEGQITPHESGFFENDPADLCTSKGLGPEDKGADYMHLNSIEKLPDGNYLISGRHTDAIYLISKEGQLVWRLGGKKNEFTLPEGVHWSGQHDVRCRSQNSTHLILTMFDNAKRPGWPDSTNMFSRGLVLSVNTENKTAEVIMRYPHPEKEHAWERGNFQTLPNGNALLFWTNDTLNSEYTPDGQLVKIARFRSGLKTYRGYKFEWDGHPNTRPTIHSQVGEIDGQLSTVVHVSWNGATRVASWNLYETDQDNGNRTILLGRQRTGFETTLVYPGYAEYVFVEAIDRLGKVLRESLPFATLEPVSNATKTALAQELESLRAGSEYTSYSSPLSSGDKVGSYQINYRVSIVAGIIFCAVGAIGARSARKFVRSRMQQRRQWMYRPLKPMEMSDAP